MATGHDLANAQRYLEQRRHDLRVQSWRTPVVFPIETPIDEPPIWSSMPETVRAYPSLLAAAMRDGRAPEMRVYLMLKAFDQTGRGVVPVGDVITLLTDASSPYRVCGRRRLRGILADGEGVFWTRSKKTDAKRETYIDIYLRSPARVAVVLSIGRMKGRPVLLPIDDLTGGIQATRAAFLAAWHEGRADDDGRANPISQATIEQMTGISAPSQWRYKVVAGIHARRNIAISPMAWRAEHRQDEAYRRGGVFRFTDHKGRRGKRGRKYIAWAIPCTYTTNLSPAPKGRLQKINRAIDLVIDGKPKGTQGNDRDEVIELYHHDGARAAKLYDRNPEHDRYIYEGGMLTPDARRPAKMTGAGRWDVLIAS